MVEVSGEKLYQWRNQSMELAIAAGISTKEVDWLIQEVATLDALSLRLESYRNCSEINLKHSLSQLTQLWQQRIRDHLPLQYLVERAFWRDWEFRVTKSVLIPRPETELVIDIVKSIDIPQQQETHLIDLGTGSGAIAIGLASCFPSAQVHAVDISSEALKIARENSNLAQVTNQISFYHGSWWQPLQRLQSKISGIISNPPYIPTSEIPKLQPEVFLHEPHLALDGGTDGLDEIRHLITESPIYLVSGGVWLIEIMAGQAKAVTELLKNNPDYERIQTISDLAGIERFILAYRV